MEHLLHSVSSAIQGDKNITKVVFSEVKKDDWKMLILHFLGLDHIGHVEGPKSKKVAPKLQEMDAIIAHIHYGMDNWVHFDHIY